MRSRVVLGAAAVVLFAVSSVWSQELQRAPLNPAFTAHLDRMLAGEGDALTASGRPLGHSPAPFELPALRPADMPKGPKAPSAYDLRQYGKVSSVQDQGQYGNCWTFGTYGSLESCILPNDTSRFSENNLAYYHGFDSQYGQGGQYWMSTAYLGRWAGPINLNDDPYDAVQRPNLSPSKHVQNVYILPGRSSSTDNEFLKQALMTYGGMYISYYHDDNYDHNGNYYYNGSQQNGNHAVTLIGWDDSYSASNFSPTPPGNGAWLIRNSWGTSWGYSGYGWISYYDNVACNRGEGLFPAVESTANYGSVFQYDALGACTWYGYGATTAYGANIFTANNGAASIQAVAFYLASASSSYEIKIYTGVSSGNPASGTLAATKTGSRAYAGYITVPLDSAVSVGSGQSFSVVVKFTTPGYNYPVPCENVQSGYSSGATIESGVSYISGNGSSWESGGTTFNCCIKAFGSGGTGPTPGPTPGPNPRAYDAYVWAYYGEYYTAYAQYYYGNYDYYGYLAYAYYFADYAHYYAYYAFLYNQAYGNDYGCAAQAYMYAYYGYLYAYYAYAYETGDAYSYYGCLSEYYACMYSYMVATGQQ